MRLSSNNPLLTAYALGELDASDKNLVETALKEQPELEREIDEIRAFADKLRAAMQPNRMTIPSDDKRNVRWQRIGMVLGIGLSIVFLVLMTQVAMKNQKPNLPTPATESATAVEVAEPIWEPRRAINLVLLIDESISMRNPDRLPLATQALGYMFDQLKREDSIAIVAYGDQVGLVLPPTPGDQRDKLRAALDKLEPAVNAPEAGAVRMAYATAMQQFIPNANNRIIVITDGDLDLGVTSDELQAYVVRQYEGGITFSIIGFGMNKDVDSEAQELTEQGGGYFSEAHDLATAKTILAKELTAVVAASANNKAEQASQAKLPQITDKVKVTGALTEKEVAPVLANTLNHMRQCYQELVQRHPSVSGTLNINLAIAPSGQVEGAKLEESKLWDSDMRGCVSEKLFRTKFPKTTNADQYTQVAYTLRFNAFALQKPQR